MPFALTAQSEPIEEVDMLVMFEGDDEDEISSVNIIIKSEGSSIIIPLTVKAATDLKTMLAEFGNYEDVEDDPSTEI